MLHIVVNLKSTYYIRYFLHHHTCIHLFALAILLLVRFVRRTITPNDHAEETISLRRSSEEKRLLCHTTYKTVHKRPLPWRRYATHKPSDEFHNKRSSALVVTRGRLATEDAVSATRRDAPGPVDCWSNLTDPNRTVVLPSTCTAYSPSTHLFALCSGH